MATPALPPNSIGKQKNSLKPTAGSYSFGTAGRDQYDKVFLTKQLEKKKGATCTPGPIYSQSSTVGRTTPRYGFGTAAKMAPTQQQCGESTVEVSSAQLDTQKIKYHKPQAAVFGYEGRETKNAAVSQVNPQSSIGQQSPGPTAYTPNAAVVTKNAPHTTFKNSSERKVGSASLASTPRHVGPGSYTVPKQKTRSFSFGTSQRPGQTPREIEPGEASLGGCTTSSMGKQYTSKGKTSANYGFGSSTRDKKDKTYLVQTAKDKRQQGSGLTPRSLPHPAVEIERERIKYS